MMKIQHWAQCPDVRKCHLRECGKSLGSGIELSVAADSGEEEEGWLVSHVSVLRVPLGKVYLAF